MDVDGVRDALARGGELTGEAGSSVLSAAGKVDEARAGLLGTTKGSGNDLVGRFEARLDRARELCDEVSAALGEARDAGERFAGVL